MVNRKAIASGVFITGREPWDVVRQSCNWMIATDAEIRAVIEGRGHLDLAERLQIDVDEDRRAVTLTLDDEFRGAARHFDGQGCVIVPDAGSGVEFAPTPVKPDVPEPKSTPWPRGDRLDDPPASTGIDLGRVDAALDLLFENSRQHTNAALVVHRGALVRERYREPFDRESRFESWSMGKSITSALIGVLVAQGRLQVDDLAPVAAWRQPGDPRGDHHHGQRRL